MKKIRLGLIGAGWVANQHLEVIKEIEELQAVGITSRTRSKAEALANEYGIAVCADNLDQLVKDARPDALMVMVSEDQMFEVTAAAIKYGLPLFVEKPAGLLPEENRKLADQAEAAGILSMVGFNRRYYSIFHKGIKIIGEHGKLLGVAVEGHERMWRVRGLNKFSDLVLENWIYANSVHTIDLLRFFGGEVLDLKAITHKYLEPKGDQFAAVMELESGALGNYSAHWHSPGGWRVVLYGEGVTVEFKPLEAGRWTDRDFKTYEIEPDDDDKRFKPGFYQQMEAFLKLVQNGKPEWPMLDLYGSYQTMLLAEKMTRGEKK
jgi:predicted dehydrogenase